MTTLAMLPELHIDSQVVPSLNAKLEPFIDVSIVPEHRHGPFTNIANSSNTSHNSNNGNNRWYIRYLPPGRDTPIPIACRHLSHFWFPHEPNAVGTYGQVFFAYEMSYPQPLPVAIKLFKHLKWKSEWTCDPYSEAPILIRLPPHRNIVKLLAVSYDRILHDQATCHQSTHAGITCSLHQAAVVPGKPTARRYTSPDLIFEMMNLGDLHNFHMKHLQPFSRSQLTHFQLDTLRGIFWDIFQALKHLKHHHIVHRDIKPENILLHHDENGLITAKLSDFGLAIDLSDRKIESQRLTSKAYSAWYRAPEVFTDKANYDHAADIWAMGILMLELVLGHSPFYPIVKDATIYALLHFGLCFQSLSQLESNQSLLFQKIRIKLTHDPLLLDLIFKTLLWRAEDRITAEQATAHPCFHSVRSRKS